MPSPASLPGHSLEQVPDEMAARCTCGGWSPPLGTSILREWDRHLASVGTTNGLQGAYPGGEVLTGQVPVPSRLLRCANTQCRVESFTYQDGRVVYCPSCYGAGQ